MDGHTPPKYTLQITKDGSVLSLAEAVRQVADGEDPTAFEGFLVEADEVSFSQEEDGFSLSERESRL